MPFITIHVSSLGNLEVNFNSYCTISDGSFDSHLQLQVWRFSLKGQVDPLFGEAYQGGIRL